MNGLYRPVLEAMKPDRLGIKSRPAAAVDSPLFVALIRTRDLHV